MISDYRGEIVEPHGTLTVRAGGFASGICVANYHYPVSNLGDLNIVIGALEKAKARGAVLVETVKRIPSR